MLSRVARAAGLGAAILSLGAFPHPSHGHEETSSTPISTTDPVDQLRHTSGVYALTNPSDVQRADRLVAPDLIVGAHPAPNGLLSQALKNSDISSIDSTPQHMLYQAVCPAGPTSCRQLDGEGVNRLVTQIGNHILRTAKSGDIRGYYLVDDYWADFSPLLAKIGDRIRAMAPEIPLVCGVSVELRPGLTGITSASQAGTPLHNALKNYSGDWCDAVVAYSYSSPTPSPPSGQVDWTMSSALPSLWAGLKSRGWNEESQILIGGPQAFNFRPRTVIRSRPIPPEYRAATSAQSLRAQVRSFCDSGAQGIIAYAWYDGSVGNVELLSNSPSLRRGYNGGIADCTARWLVEPFN